VALRPDGERLAAGSADQTVRIWDSATGKEFCVLRGRAGWVKSMAFSQARKRLASANGASPIHLWQTTSVSRDLRHRRATNQIVSELFGQMRPRADVLARLRTLPAIGLSRRQDVFVVAEIYPEDSSVLDALA
jgi:WD40 repeat protein